MNTFTDTSQQRFIELINYFKGCGYNQNYTEFEIVFSERNDLDYFSAIRSAQDDLFEEIESNLTNFYQKLDPHAERVRYLRELKTTLIKITQFKILERIVPKEEFIKYDWKQLIDGHYNSEGICKLNIDLDKKQIINASGLLHQMVREIIDFIDMKLENDKTLSNYEDIVPDKSIYNSKSLKSKLIYHNFEQLEKVKNLSEKSLQDLYLRLEHQSRDYKIAFLAFLGFYDLLFETYGGKIGKVDSIISEILCINIYDARDLRTSLTKPNGYKKGRFKAHSCKKIVDIYYKELITQKK